jgi:hypothetical protein
VRLAADLLAAAEALQHRLEGARTGTESVRRGRSCG